MKRNLTRALTVLAIFFTGQTLVAAPQATTKDVVVGLNDVFVPGGFDSETDAYVVVNGLFPNGCYRWKAAEVKHVDQFRHEIQPMATVTQGVCIRVLVPFTKEVKLGRLQPGKHTLKFLDGDGTFIEKDLNVE